RRPRSAAGVRASARAPGGVHPRRHLHGRRAGLGALQERTARAGDARDAPRAASRDRRRAPALSRRDDRRRDGSPGPCDPPPLPCPRAQPVLRPAPGAARPCDPRSCRPTRATVSGGPAMKGLFALAFVAVPALVTAHPLGNFTVNRYAALHVTPDVLAVRYV